MTFKSLWQNITTALHNDVDFVSQSQNDIDIVPVWKTDWFTLIYWNRYWDIKQYWCHSSMKQNYSDVDIVFYTRNINIILYQTTK